VIALPQASGETTSKTFDHISYSAISTFQACPLRFYFRYVLGLPERTISSGLVFGSALHRAVQYHFERLLIGDSGTDVDTLLDVFQDHWDSYQDQAILYGKGENRDALGRLVERQLTFPTDDN